MSDTAIAALMEPEIEGLKAGLRGELIRPGDENYDEARKVYNAIHDRHPVADILGGPTFFPLDGDVFRSYRKLMAEAPEALGALLGLALAPPVPFIPQEWHGKPVCVVLACWTGPTDEGEEILKTVETWAPVIGRAVGRMPYPAINTLFDDLLPPGLYHYWKGHFVRGLPDEAIEVHLAYGSTIPSAQTATLLFPIDGACHRVAPEETAFAYRDADFAVGLGPSWPDPADTAANIEWGRRYSEAVAPYAEEGGYVNFMSGDDQGRIRANYRQNYDRLIEVKNKYDPDNLFRMNQNIAPRGSEARGRIEYDR